RRRWPRRRRRSPTCRKKSLPSPPPRRPPRWSRRRRSRSHNRSPRRRRKTRCERSAVAVDTIRRAMPKEQRVIRIHGKVQGVGYRFFATRVARRLGLKGSIQNNRDATVDAVVEGEKDAINDWIEQL